MNRVFRMVLLALLLGMVGARGGVMLPEGVDIPFKKYKLANGLTLVVHEDRKAPIVAVNV
jgi:zinc protease